MRRLNTVSLKIYTYKVFISWDRKAIYLHILAQSVRVVNKSNSRELRSPKHPVQQAADTADRPDCFVSCMSAVCSVANQSAKAGSSKNTNARWLLSQQQLRLCYKRNCWTVWSSFKPPGVSNGLYRGNHFTHQFAEKGYCLRSSVRRRGRRFVRLATRFPKDTFLYKSKNIWSHIFSLCNKPQVSIC
jgi:hypothetical protein